MLEKVSKSLAVNIIKLYPSYPNENDLRISEIFRHDNYTRVSIEQQNQIKLNSAMFRYNQEKQKSFFDIFFPYMQFNEFYDKKILDLGCFTGGKLVFWMQRYGFREGRGIDISPVFADAGNIFAKKMGVKNVIFDTGFGENLPYASNSFDFIVSYDVFEHVQNLEQVMQECCRVLKPGGKILFAFPPYFALGEEHFTLITKMIGLQWFFSGKTLTKAYNEIIAERGKEADWYAPGKTQEWEKLPALNGTTVADFRHIIAKNKRWKILYCNKNTFAHRTGLNSRLLRFMRILIKIPASLPIFEEFFLSRICCSFEKIDVNSVGS